MMAAFMTTALPVHVHLNIGSNITPLVANPSRIARKRHRKRLNTNTTTTCQQSQLDDTSDSPVPKFRKDEQLPQTSFFPSKPTTGKAPSPNDRVLEQVIQTMDKLGVKEEKQVSQIPTNIASIQDLSRGNPWSALLGSAGAAIMSAAAWRMLTAVVAFAVLHPMDDRIYIIQRITVVIRTALVCIFALGSGISGVTSLGLLLLSFRLTYAVITKEFHNVGGDEDDNK